MSGAVGWTICGSVERWVRQSVGQWSGGSVGLSVGEWSGELIVRSVG